MISSPSRGMMPFRNLIFVCLLLLIQSLLAAEFRPGVPQVDTDGNPIHAHGGCILKVGSTWYWWGENTRVPGCQFACFNGINCYSSADLQNWRFEGKVLVPTTSGYLSREWVAYRPKVMYNENTSKFIMILTECCPESGGWDGHLTFASSDGPTGPYAYEGWSWGAEETVVMDMSVFKDDDGAGYVVYSANNKFVAIDRLSGDYLSVESRVAELGNTCEEAPCLFKTDGRYYLYHSYCTGWASNQGHYRTAKDIAGPWGNAYNLADDDTYDSQGAYIFSVTGSKATTFIYAGDRWNCPSNDCTLSDAVYVWLPISINGGEMSLDWYYTWHLNLATGEWSVDPFQKPVLSRFSIDPSDTASRSHSLGCDGPAELHSEEGVVGLPEGEKLQSRLRTTPP